jgi:hypothetical protein
LTGCSKYNEHTIFIALCYSEPVVDIVLKHTTGGWSYLTVKVRCACSVKHHM